MLWPPFNRCILIALLLGTHAKAVQVAKSDTHPLNRHKTVQNCSVLTSGQITEAFLSARGEVCYVVKILPGESARLLVDQPEDLEIHVHDQQSDQLFDGFDFGPESATIVSSGDYTINIAKVSPSPNSLSFSVARISIPEDKAAMWRNAEIWATSSKRTSSHENLARSLEVWTQAGDERSVARTYLKLGSMSFHDGDFIAARDAWEKGLTLCRQMSDARCAAEAENNSYNALFDLGDICAAEQRLRESALDWDRAPDKVKAGITYSNLGYFLWQTGDIEHSVIALEHARAVLQGKDLIAYAISVNNLGLCYQSLSEYEKATQFFQQAITELLRAKGPPNTLARMRLNLGRNLMLQGKAIPAMAILEQVLHTAQELKDRRTEGDVLGNLGQNLYHAGKYAEARSRFEEALSVYRSRGDRRGESSALHYLGLINQQAGDAAAARSLLEQALKIREEIFLRDDAAETLFALAQLEYNAGNISAAGNRAEEALKLLELVRSHVPGEALRASFYSRKKPFFNLLVDIAMAPGTPEAEAAGFLAAERGRARALLDLLAGGSLIEQIPPDLAARRTRLQHELDFLSLRLSLTPESKATALRNQVEQLVADDERVEAEIRGLVPDEKFSRTLTSVSRLQTQYIPSDSALLEFSLGAQHNYLWVVEPTRIRSFLLPKESEIEAKALPVIKEFGNILARRRSPARAARFNKALEDLSVALLGKLSGIDLPQRLILVPDAILQRVPFAALRLPGEPEALGFTHDLVRVPSAAYLTVGRSPQPFSSFHQTILAIADPVFSSNDPRVPRSQDKKLPMRGVDLPRLPFTEELGVIEKTVPASQRQILRGFDASRAGLERTPLSDFGVIHFSTHALIDDKIPELSRVALSMVNRTGASIDGFLRPYQLAQFHVNGSTVVLSACNTALGKQVQGEGLAGLTSSLLFAGSSQLVLTLTDVDAESSSHFLASVYGQFLTGTTSMEHSMMLSRRTMAHSSRFSDPYHWASFITVGLPSQITVNATRQRTERTN